MKIVKKNKTYFLNLKNNDECNLLDCFLDTELNINVINKYTIAFSVIDDLKKNNLKDSSGVKKNTVILKETTSNLKDNESLIREKIIDLLQDKEFPINNKVEGIFENFLKKEDLVFFKKMLLDKTVITYKQSDKYKKSLYVINQQFIKTPEEQIIKENNSKLLDSKSNENIDSVVKDFYKKKYSLIKSVDVANSFSKQLYPKFKNNEIKGIKSFDGYFYVIFVDFYLSLKEQIFSCNLNKNFTLEDLSKLLNKETELLKIVIEFLKEEGLLIEKRKNIFYLI